MTPTRLGHLLTRRLPRALHPGAWWIWALGMAVAASLTTNPLLLVTMLGVIGVVVTCRRGEAPWAKGFRAYLLLALIVIVIRVLLRALLGTAVTDSDQVLVTLPQVPLPHWMAGVHLGGPVDLEGVLAAATDGLRLGTLLVCVGAATTLANPKRVLRLLPGALYEIGTTVVVAVTVAPQLVESGRRVVRARKLRGETGRPVRTVVVPVLADALDRALCLAAAMDSRGYGRRGPRSRRSRHGGAALLVLGLVALSLGSYWLLGTPQRRLAVSVLVGGVAVCCLGLFLGSRRTVHSRYRPDFWRTEEWVVAGCGILVVVLMLRGDPLVLSPPSLTTPMLSSVTVLALLVGLLPAFAAPAPPTLSARYRLGELA